HAQGIPLANGDVGNVKWYQFKIPIHSPDLVVGSIQDFKSIRFLRMFFQGFKEPIVCRFATLDLVRGEWRKYSNNEDLLSPGEWIPDDVQSETSFDISAVNIEENGLRIPIHYVTPPGIEREMNLGTTNLTKMNEQSMVLKVTDLIDGDARAAYKTVDFDFRQYKKLKMFVHAEKSKENEYLKYGDLTVFIRIGADFTENFYEYEIPLTFTDWGTSSAEAIWPYSNEFDIDLQELVDVKHERNIKMRESGSTVNLSFPYYSYDGNNRITVCGSPNISDVEAIMIGVRNPKKTDLTGDDDGESKSAEIWVNELRLTDFNKKGGWATTNRIGVNLADLGNVILSGSYSSAGFGSIDKKLNETQKESITQFDIATNLEIGKFFPEKTGIRIPVHFDYSEARITPEYNPLDPDIKLQKDLKSYDSKSQKDSIKRLTLDYTQRKNINFINVRKDKVGASSKPRFYDVENFNVSYSYSEIYHRNIDIEYDLQKTYNGGIGYNFSGNPKNVKPFEKIGFISDNKAFQLIKDFNFYFLPKMFSFRTDMNRVNNEKKLRNKSMADVITFPYYYRTWDWTRVYDLKFDLAKSLTLNFSTNANSYIDEPSGSLNKNDKDYKLKRDTIIDQILSLGTMNRYSQSLGINYNVPINKIPLLDWLTMQAGYQSSYNWTASPQSIQDFMGNTIANNNTKLLSGNLDLVKLYNKIGYLKKINEGKKKTKKDRGKKSKDEPDGNQQDNKDTTKIQDKPEVNYLKLVSDNVLRILMGFRKASISYTENNGTSIPGFMPEPGPLGNDWNKNAPGFGFIFGKQPDGPEYFREWLTTSSRLNTAFITNYNNNLTLRGTFEPIKDLKIEITADRTYAQNFQEYYVADSILGDFKHSNSIE
ncbi:MAG: cell surface protein SprA, partial [Bacteroidales bacterium]|nr:cell surface protein SprA [Bacteroidales bacterium]